MLTVNFEQWMEELRRIHWLLAGIGRDEDEQEAWDSYDPGLEDSVWRAYYQDGLLPAEAIIEDWRNAA